LITDSPRTQAGTRARIPARVPDLRSRSDASRLRPPALIREPPPREGRATSPRKPATTLSSRSRRTGTCSRSTPTLIASMPSARYVMRETGGATHGVVR